MRLATKIAALLTFCALLAAPSLGAQDALSLAKAQALALGRSAALQGAILGVDSASLAAQAQGYATLPSISASAGGTFDFGRLSSISPDFSTAASGTVALSATETVYNGGKTATLVKKYGLATEAARETARSTRISVLGQVESAFYAVLQAAASVDAAASNLEAARLSQMIAQAKIDAGILSKSDFLQTEADTAGYETTLILAKNSLGSAKAALASLTGLPAATALEQVDFSSYGDLVARLCALDGAGIDKLSIDVSSLARSSNPTLSSYALSSEQARLAVDIARTLYLPTIAAGFSQSLGYQHDSGLSTTGSVSLMASLSLDLWNTRNAVDAAAVVAKQADYSGSQGKTDLLLSVVQALYQWLGSAGSITSATKALDYAKSNYENVLGKFKLSSATTSDLSTAEALVSADSTALIAARYGFLTNLSKLSGLAGLEDEGKLLALVP